MTTHYTTYGTKSGGCDHKHETLHASWKCWDLAMYKGSHGAGCDREILVGLEDGTFRKLTQAEQDEADAYSPDYH